MAVRREGKRGGGRGRCSSTRMAVAAGLGGNGGLKTGEERRWSGCRRRWEAEGRKRDTHQGGRGGPSRVWHVARWRDGPGADSGVGVAGAGGGVAASRGAASVGLWAAGGVAAGPA
jgi:hypothetical protein